jgi:hypothetical protein
MRKILAVLCCVPSVLFAQEKTTDSSGSNWSLSSSAFYYFLPDEENLLNVVGSADHKSLHLEARYNYEDRKTLSAYAGWRFEAGKNFQFAAIPMVGFATGNTDAFIPALELEASYKIFDFYSESEYLLDFESKENNFAYTWSEVAVNPTDFLRLGIVAQRTRLYETEFDLQRGLLAQYSFWKLTAGAYYFNPFSNDDFLSVSLSIDF